MVVEAGIMLALSCALSMLTIYKMPQGGSITAGSMIPIIFFAVRWGVGPGLLTGLAYGLIQAILPGAYIMHPIQFLLDYPVAFTCLGLAGFFNKDNASILAGTALAVLGRLVCHILSGVVFFGEYAPVGQSPWVYSLIYNGTFLGVEFIITAILVVLLVKFVPQMKK
jgi:thiamine transporter